MQCISLFNIPNIKMRRGIKLIKKVKVIKVKEGKVCPSVWSKYQHKFLCDVIRRKDWANYGIIPKEVEEDMLVLNPSITIKQAWYQYTNTLLVKYKDIFTEKIKAQKTTTHRKVITVTQKYICHMQVENEFQFLRGNNIGNLLDWRTFVGVFEYPPLGDDETCCIASDDQVNVVGDTVFVFPKIGYLYSTHFVTYSKLQQHEKLWTTQGCPFKFTGLVVPEEKQG